MDYKKIKNYPYIVSIHSLEIEKEYRGKGHGKVFIKMLVDFIKERFNNTLGIYLSVMVDNHPAIKIYKDAGFIILGKHSLMSLNKSYYDMGLFQ